MAAAAVVPSVTRQPGCAWALLILAALYFIGMVAWLVLFLTHETPG